MTHTFSWMLLLTVSAVLALDQSQLPVYTLCSTVKGFASDMNSEFLVKAAQGPRANEAIVLVIRSAPYVPGLTFIAARINATYKVAGSDIIAQSDMYGILQITDQIEADTEIHVRVINSHDDLATPFIFYSYHAGYRSCYLDISPHLSFTGPIPTHIENTNTEAPLYLKAIPPKGATSYRIALTGAIVVKQGIAENVDVQNQKAVPLPATSEAILLTVRPSPDARVQMIHLTIFFDFGGASQPAAPTPPAPETVRAPSPTAPQTPNGAPSPAEKVAQSSTSYFSLFIVLILVYFTSRSIYNYRVKHITDFPEFVPHHEVFSRINKFCATFAMHLRDKGRGAVYAQRGGYSDVNRDEMQDVS